MKPLRILILMAISLLMLAGRTVYVGQESSLVYSWFINDAAFTAGWSNCYPFQNVLVDTDGIVGCLVPPGRTLILEEIGATAGAALITADGEECKIVLETNSDGTATTATEIASSLINVGALNNNATGNCGAGSVIIDARGEGCTRTIDGSDANASVPGGGFWRVSVQTGTDAGGDSCGGACTCDTLQAVNINVVARLE